MNRRLPWPRLKYPISNCEEPGVAKFMDVHNGLAGARRAGHAEPAPLPNGDRRVLSH